MPDHSPGSVLHAEVFPSAPLALRPARRNGNANDVFPISFAPCQHFSTCALFPSHFRGRQAKPWNSSASPYSQQAMSALFCMHSFLSPFSQAANQAVKFLCFFLFTAGMSALFCMHSWLSPWPRAANQVVKFLCFFLFKERRESFIYAANAWGRPPRT